MAPALYPALKKERFLLDDSGTYLLTDEQRKARTLTVTLERVDLGQNQKYYNFSTPEPESFWGYIQWVDRDFIVETKQLQYRREVILDYTHQSPDETEQLRCLIKETAVFIFDNLTGVMIAAGNSAEQLGQERAEYLLATGQQRLTPVEQRTALWYSFPNNVGGFITLQWGDYPSICGNFAGNQTAPSSSAPGKGDSGNGGNGGGGSRPSEPPPANRSADPDSDSPTPPPPVPSGPPVPKPAAPPPPPNQLFRIVATSGRSQATGTGYEPIGVRLVSAPGPSEIAQFSAAATPGGPVRWFNIDQGPVGRLTPAIVSKTPM